jgi:hypothetical protein
LKNKICKYFHIEEAEDFESRKSFEIIGEDIDKECESENDDEDVVRLCEENKKDFNSDENDGGRDLEDEKIRAIDNLIVD